MRNYDKAYYKTYLHYNDYKAKLNGISNSNYLQVDNIKKILNTDNEDFPWIFLWENWIEKVNTCYNWFYDDKPKAWTKQSNSASFRKFNLNPFDEDKDKPDRAIPVIDFGDFITFFNNGKVSEDFKKLLNIDYNLYYKELKKFDYYISVPFTEMKESLDGVFYDVITSIGSSSDEFIAKKNFYNKKNKAQPRIIITYDSLLKDNSNTIQSNIAKLNDPTSFNIDDSDDVAINDRKVLLTDTASRIYKVIQSLLDMYTNIYNTYQQIKTKEPAQPYQIDPAKFNVARQDIGSLSIDEALTLARPRIKPAFKKSYIVRENNLKPFLNIRMEYQVGLDSSDFIDVNYFTVPYNNIQSLEHNVGQHNMTISLIDTEGNLSELLIQKMYAASQKKANAMVEKNVRPTGEYRFFVEYGWSGPDTDSEEEFLEEQVYVKTTQRGYIKSISSQYSFKGTEYTLNIIPNDLSSLNEGFNDTSSLYHNNASDSNFTPVVGLIVLFLLLKNPDEDLLYKKIAVDKDKSFLEQLFTFIEGLYIVKDNSGYYLTDQAKPNIKNNLHYKTNGQNFLLNHKMDEEGEKIWVDDNSTKLLARELFKEVRPENPKNKKDTVNSKKISSIKYTADSLEAIKKVCDTENVKLNAWLVGVYIIWKTYRDNFKKAIICDNTGLFDIFQENGDFKSDDDIIKIINVFNPFCLKKGITGDTNGKRIYKTILEKNNFNNYFLGNILDIEADPSPKEDERPRMLTFLVKQLNGIFNEVRNVGMNVESGDDNVYHGSDGVMLYYDIYKPGYDNLQDFLFEYKRKIYSDKDNIYWSTDRFPGTTEDKRHEARYQVFENLVKKAFATADKAAFENFMNDMDEYYKNKENKETDRENLKTVTGTKREGSAKAVKDYNNAIKAQKGKISGEIDELDKNFENTRKEAAKKISPFPVFYLTYISSSTKVSSLNCSLSKKLNLLGKQLVQSYSYTPRITPKTRNFNRQIFSQGNSSIIKEGSGDIIEFSIDPIDIGNFNSIMLANKNKNNVGYNNVSSHSFVGGMYQNASQYYKSYRGVEGNENVAKIAQDMARLDLNYQSQTAIKGSITIIGEPYWSNINLLMSKCIYINVYYSNGSRCSHSGIYHVSGVVQSISDGKFTTKLEIIRAPTFLSSLEKIVNKNKYIS
jgi:hypothetical protein